MKVNVYTKQEIDNTVNYLKALKAKYEETDLVNSGTLNYESRILIENAMESGAKFLKFKSLPNWSEKCMKDFRTLDLSFIDGAFQRQRALIF